MPLQEVLVWDGKQLPRPAGVLFDPPCTTREQDIKLWNSLIKPTLAQMSIARYIMAVVQCRNTRKWDDGTKQFKFAPKEDYLVATYSISARLGAPYKPGIVAERWVDKAFAQANKRTLNLDQDCIQIFQCSEKGCQLSANGILALTEFNMKNGKKTVEAFTEARAKLVNPIEFGWRGGAFPPLVNTRNY